MQFTPVLTSITPVFINYSNMVILLRCNILYHKCALLTLFLLDKSIFYCHKCLNGSTPGGDKLVGEFQYTLIILSFFFNRAVRWWQQHCLDVSEHQWSSAAPQRHSGLPHDPFTKVNGKHSLILLSAFFMLIHCEIQMFFFPNDTCFCEH